MYRRQMTGTPFFVVAGNHDLWFTIPQSFFDAFVLPTNTVPPVTARAGRHGAGALTTRSTTATRISRGSTRRCTDASRAHAGHGPVAVARGRPRRFDEALEVPVPAPAADEFRSARRRRLQPRRTPGFARTCRTSSCPGAAGAGPDDLLRSHHAYERFRPFRGFTASVSGGSSGVLYGLAERRPASAQFFPAGTVPRTWPSPATPCTCGLQRFGDFLDEMFLEHCLLRSGLRGPSGVRPDVSLDAPGDGNTTAPVGTRLSRPADPVRPADFSTPSTRYTWATITTTFTSASNGRSCPTGAYSCSSEAPLCRGSRRWPLGNGVVDPQGGRGRAAISSDLELPEAPPDVASCSATSSPTASSTAFRAPTSPLRLGPPVVTTDLALDIGRACCRLNTGSAISPARARTVESLRRRTGRSRASGYADFVVVSLPLSEVARSAVGEIVGSARTWVAPGLVANAEAPARFLDQAFLARSLRARPRPGRPRGTRGQDRPRSRPRR